MENVYKTELTEFQRQPAGGADTVVVQIEMLKETYDLMQQVIQRNQWDAREGALTLLALGLGYAQGKLSVESDEATQQALAERLTNLESAYAVMKYRAYSYMKDNQTLELKNSGCEAEITALTNLVKRLRDEMRELKAENARLQRLAPLAEPEGSVGRPAASAASAPAKPKGFLARLRFLLGGEA